MSLPWNACTHLYSHARRICSVPSNIITQKHKVSWREDKPLSLISEILSVLFLGSHAVTHRQSVLHHPSQVILCLMTFGTARTIIYQACTVHFLLQIDSLSLLEWWQYKYQWYGSDVSFALFLLLHIHWWGMEGKVVIPFNNNILSGLYFKWSASGNCWGISSCHCMWSVVL